MPRTQERASNEGRSIAVAMDSEEFHSGFAYGMTGVPNGPCRYPIDGIATEAGILDIVRNLTEIAVEGWLSEEQLRHDVGVLVGWVLRRS